MENAQIDLTTEVPERLHRLLFARLHNRGDGIRSDILNRGQAVTDGGLL